MSIKPDLGPTDRLDLHHVDKLLDRCDFTRRQMKAHLTAKDQLDQMVVEQDLIDPSKTGLDLCLRERSIAAFAKGLNARIELTRIKRAGRFLM